MNKELENIVKDNQANGTFITSRQFFIAANTEIQMVLYGIRRMSIMVRDLNGATPIYASAYQQAEAALRNADRRSAFVELRVAENRVCKQILWLNRLHKQVARKPFLSRLFDFEAVKISAPNNREAEAMILEFLKNIGYDTESFELRVL